MPRDKCKEVSDKMLWRPRRKGDPPTGPQDASNFGQSDFCSWCEHVPELTENDVEACISVGQSFSVSLSPFNGPALRHPLVLTCMLEQFWREIER